MGCLKKIALINTFVACFNICSRTLVSIITLAAYTLTDPTHILSAEKTFFALNLFNIMKNALIVLPNLFSSAIQASVSIQRLNKYLNMEELDRVAVSHDDHFGDPILTLNANLAWTSKNLTLKDLNFNVKEGELVAVVGRTGSGKSSLLNALVGNLIKFEGIVNTRGTVSYVSQSPWIQNVSLKDNILFGDPLNAVHYKRIIEACDLNQDLEQLPFEDETEIGENGINLSGGQKQRVALARAGYKDASIYLFDDPLSAVDSHVGKNIFRKLIGPSGILRHKTRILVTHDIRFLSQVDRIFVMKNGQLGETGTCKELITKQGYYAEFISEHFETEIDGNDVDPALRSLIENLENSTGRIRKKSITYQSTRSRRSSKFVEPNLNHRFVAPATKKARVVAEEKVTVGNTNLNVFRIYFKAAGFWMSILALAFTLLSSALTAYSNIWISKWTNESTLDKLAMGRTQGSSTYWYLTGYGCIGIVQGCVTFISIWTMALVCLEAARTLQSRALSRVFRAPMSYFDTTLMGSLIDRFSKDVDTLDSEIPMNLKSFTQIFCAVACMFGVISSATPRFIDFIIPLAILYGFVQRFYVATSRQLQRLYASTTSPIYSHFSETVAGCSVIRAFGLEGKFIAESERRIDLNQMANFTLAMFNIWVSIRLELLGVVVICSTCILTLLSRDSMTPGNAGLAISYAFQVTLLLNLMAKQMCTLESNLVSAERVEELSHIPQEAPWENPRNDPPPFWPSKGAVKFQNYKLKYRDGELVLKGISCNIQPGEKIGVVGRTGAGKSSMTLALFRIIEAAGGKILVDGIDISTLGLHNLRGKITIIPQDPVMFSGTLRSNLDPFGQYSDEKLWECLELAHLKSFILTLSGNLQYKLGDKGNNLSVGQKQLICIARALLRKTKILVLDEATAAVDLETDNLIQKTIRHQFSDATVITIAHRLNTIMDSNRVLVLDNGEIMEFDTPANLIERKNSLFNRMARDTTII